MPGPLNIEVGLHILVNIALSLLARTAEIQLQLAAIIGEGFGGVDLERVDKHNMCMVHANCFEWTL